MSEREYSPSDLDKILDGERKVILASGFETTKAEIEWAKETLRTHPQAYEFASIEDIICLKRSQDEYEAGKGIRCHINR